MRINFPNYVETIKLPSVKALYPLFEAISNSIDSIEESKVKDGRIVVVLERQKQGLLEKEDVEENKELLPIENLIIEDNGVGFKEANFGAFSELNTVWKKNKGGKGIGRVIWLKTFHHAEIESVYLDGIIGKEFRKFNFVCKEDAIENITNGIADPGVEVKTRVRLVGCKKEYQDSMPRKRNVIAQEIIIHFLPYFMVSNMPTIILREKDLDDIDLWQEFESYITEKGQGETFNIGNQGFNITHTKTKYHSIRNKEHRVFYVANGRVVETRSISSDKIANLPSKLQIEDEEYIYVGYVESPYLDEHVNQSRFTFDFPETTEGEELFKQIDWQSIEGKVDASIGNYLVNFLEQTKNDKEEKIKQFINEKAPNYSYIYNQHKDLIDKIPLKSIERGNIGQELTKIHTSLRATLAEEAEKIINISDSEIASSDEYKEEMKTLLERLDPTGKADLAEYIIHRKIVLRLFEKALKIKDDGKFVKEDVIHNYIFPIKKSTDEITYKQHNLWVLDERLAYNTYIASDKPFSSIFGFENISDEEKKKRPDIYAYSFLTVEPDNTKSPFRSLDLFEFKRPMRDDYTSDDNPYNQVKDYLQIIRQGNATTKDKRSFSVINGGLIYCHVVCDFTNKLRDLLNHDEFNQVGNEDWYVHYHQTYHAFIEVKSFEYVLETATKSNQILFDELGLN
jgi:hypothetical protein